MPYYLGHIPQLSWVYGNLDYSFNKYHRHYQAHDDWYPDRKNKSLGFKAGGFTEKTRHLSKYMTLAPSFMPRGCSKEIRKYKYCTDNKGHLNCFNEKISIMEVCPDHVLDGLKEKKKWFMRAESIDNQTYKRAMSVSDYNKGRSVSDLHLKTWDDGKAENMRTDSYWQDDRYDPVKHPHPHRYDNSNFAEQEYTDIFGGTRGDGERTERERQKVGVVSGASKAMEEDA